MALRYQWYAEHKNKLITHAPISRFYFNFRKKKRWFINDFSAFNYTWPSISYILNLFVCNFWRKYLNRNLRYRLSVFTTFINSSLCARIRALNTMFRIVFSISEFQRTHILYKTIIILSRITRSEERRVGKEV